MSCFRFSRTLWSGEGENPASHSPVLAVVVALIGILPREGLRPLRDPDAVELDDDDDGREA
ncbi:hypothetical protein [Streptomyces bobili]|uniref:hypothetical protein n=1 Tax=Streptomyces bobili TaxID=67280 RepID=UPI0037240624